MRGEARDGNQRAVAMRVDPLVPRANASLSVHCRWVKIGVKHFAALPVARAHQSPAEGAASNLGEKLPKCKYQFDIILVSLNSIQHKPVDAGYRRICKPAPLRHVFWAERLAERVGRRVHAVA